MDPSEKQVRISRALSEGMNCLGIFVCGPGFAEYRAEAESALARWEADYAPGFREIASHADLWIRGGDAGAFRSAVARISELATAGVNLDAPDQLAAVRGAVWQLLGSMGPAIPK